MRSRTHLESLRARESMRSRGCQDARIRPVKTGIDCRTPRGTRELRRRRRTDAVPVISRPPYESACSSRLQRHLRVAPTLRTPTSLTHRWCARYLYPCHHLCSQARDSNAKPNINFSSGLVQVFCRLSSIHLASCLLTVQILTGPRRMLRTGQSRAGACFSSSSVGCQAPSAHYLGAALTCTLTRQTLGQLGPFSFGLSNGAKYTKETRQGGLEILSSTDDAYSTQRHDTCQETITREI